MMHGCGEKENTGLVGVGEKNEDDRWFAMVKPEWESRKEVKDRSNKWSSADWSKNKNHALTNHQKTLLLN